jgi:Protein of unknown function (DUF2877)
MTVAALQVGVGAAEVLRVAARGDVLATFPAATYVRLDNGLICLTGPAVAAGPIHVRCRELPAAVLGEPVGCDGAQLVAKGWSLDLQAPIYRGTLPPAADLQAGAALLLDAFADLPPAWLLTGDVPAVWPDHAVVLGHGDLGIAAAVLGGRGRGLTPAGDDVLGGLLVIAAAYGVGSPAEREQAAAQSRTHDIAANFLRWAARGQCIAPVHDLLAAAAAGDRVTTRRAAARLRAIGGSSGSDLAYGLTLGLRHLPH